jgi:hypothetical protein
MLIHAYLLNIIGLVKYKYIEYFKMSTPYAKSEMNKQNKKRIKYLYTLSYK